LCGPSAVAELLVTYTVLVNVNSKQRIFYSTDYSTTIIITFTDYDDDDKHANVYAALFKA